MSDPINFNIEELTARYELHPERRDVFVEAEQDKALIRAFLDSERSQPIALFSVSVVNIPAASLLAKGLPHPSRRSEVITLAMELETRKVSPQQVVCIADADFEYLLPHGLKCGLLLLTDYASMELYAFTNEAIHSVLVVTAPKTASTGASMVEVLSGPLQFLFSVRGVNFSLQLGLPWIDAIDKFFSLQNHRLQFDEGEFMKRYLVDRVPQTVTDKFKSKLLEIQSLLSSDIRCRIRGHDFIKVFTWYLRTVEKCKHLNEDSVRQLLYVSVRPSELASLPMFSSLRSRFATF
jgi:hypothetical protein